MSRSTVRTNRIKEQLNSTVFKTFLATHDTQTETIVRRLFKNSNKYLSNIEDKNICSIAASLIITNAIESDVNTYTLIMNNPRSIEASELIINEARKNIRAIMALENKFHKGSCQDEYLAVIKRVVIEYFVSKNKRFHTDKLIEELRTLGIRFSIQQEYYPWRYIKSVEDIIEELSLKDVPDIVDEFDDSEQKKRFEVLSSAILCNGDVFRIKSIVESDMK